MNTRQSNKKEMIDNLVAYLDSNVKTWSPIKKAGEFFNELKNKQQQINASAAEQLSTNVFLGQNKSQLKYTISEKADIVNDIIECYASVEGNTELEQKMADSLSDLNRLRIEEFVLKIDTIIIAAEAHKKVLTEEYGLTEEQLTDLKVDINSFNQLRGAPRAYQIASTQATAELSDLFDQADDILTNKLDKVMKIFKSRDPKFFQGYLSARIIVD